ncbi:MAG: hypothetical protein IT317_03525 [Anaerolineales bacterium]|nr:hypothetical protein [Anaerolineales bacterium]
MLRPLGLVSRLTAALIILAALSAGPRTALAQPAPAPGAAFVVDSLADLPDADLGNPACLASNGKCTLRAALQQAGNTDEFDTITFSVTGTIELTAGLPPITHTLNLTGPGPALLTLDGNGHGPVLLVSADDPVGPVNISGLTVTGGLGEEGGAARFNGLAPVIVTNVVITGNLAVLGGGLNINSPTTIVDSLISHNQATELGGGLHALSLLELINTRVEENAVQPTGSVTAQGSLGQGGGGLFIGGGLAMTNSLVLSNTAAGAVAPLGAAAFGPAASGGALGAGIYVYDSFALITDSVIAGNAGVACISCPVPPLLSASPAGVGPEFYGQGGGVFAYTSGLNLTDSQVLSNTAASGGGLYLKGGQIVLQTALVAQNRADSGGGVVIVSGNGYFSDVVVRDNWAVTGLAGGVYAGDGYASLHQTLIVDNNALGDGGGFYASAAEVYIGYSQIQGNASGHALPVAQGLSLEPQVLSDQGGGVYLAGGDAEIYNSAIISNTGTLGAGINSSGVLAVVNTTLSGNRAKRDGGGLRLAPVPVSLASGQAPPPSTASLLLVTVANNTADADNNGSGDGGGLFAAPGLSITLHSTLLALNTDLGGQAVTCAGTANSIGYNLVDVTAGCPITATTGDQFNVAAGILPLADNGGGTFSHALTFTSPARDTGDPYWDFCLPQDQRDVGRPFGVTCDIGAFELSGLFLPLLTR